MWLTWWLGDTTGALVVAPVLVLWCLRPRWRPNLRRDSKSDRSSCFDDSWANGFWRMVSNFRQKLSDLVYFRTGDYLDRVPIFTTRNRNQHFHSLGPGHLGNAARFRAVYHGRRRTNRCSSCKDTTAVFAITALALAAGCAERRGAEAAIEQQKATVEAANRTKDNFLAMLSHELRTPLTPVLAALERLESNSGRVRRCENRPWP